MQRPQREKTPPRSNAPHSAGQRLLLEADLYTGKFGEVGEIMAKKKKKKSGWRPGVLDGPDPTFEELEEWINKMIQEPRITPADTQDAEAVPEVTPKG